MYVFSAFRLQAPTDHEQQPHREANFWYPREERGEEDGRKFSPLYIISLDSDFYRSFNYRLRSNKAAKQ